MFEWFKSKNQKRSDSVSGVNVSNLVASNGSLFGGYMNPMRASTVYACVKVLGESAAMLPWKLYRYGPRKKTDGTVSSFPPRYEQWQHPLYKCLLVQPNPNMTAFNFRMYMMRNLVLTGDAYAYIVRDAQGRCSELWPLAPHSVNPVLHSDGSVTCSVTLGTGQFIPDMPRSELFHVCLNPADEYSLRGINPIEMQRRLLNIDDNAIDSLEQQYKNGVNTNLAITTPDNVWLDAKKFERLKDQITDTYAGVANTGKPLLLEGGLQAKPVGISNKDAQFLELYQFTQEQICKLFRVPPHMIGDLRRSTFSNIEHQSLEFLNFTLTPYLNAFEQASWANLLTKEEQSCYYTDFDTTEVERGDRSSRYSAYSTGIQNGILSPNECRASEDLPPREGGDEYLTPLNMRSNQETEPQEDTSTETEPKEDSVSDDKEE